MINFFNKQQDPKDFSKLLTQFKKLKKDFSKLSEELQEIKQESKFALQKIGVIRFNPFKEIGGNQSFSIAMLDANNNGVVITGFYSKEGNRVFAKPIIKGKSKYSLTAEEKKALEKAISENDTKSNGKEKNKK
jgi:hypothetical protein